MARYVLFLALWLLACAPSATDDQLNPARDRSELPGTASTMPKSGKAEEVYSCKNNCGQLPYVYGTGCTCTLECVLYNTCCPDFLLECKTCSSPAPTPFRKCINQNEFTFNKITCKLESNQWKEETYTKTCPNGFTCQNGQCQPPQEIPTGEYEVVVCGINHGGGWNGKIKLRKAGGKLFVIEPNNSYPGKSIIVPVGTHGIFNKLFFRDCAYDVRYQGSVKQNGGILEVEYNKYDEWYKCKVIEGHLERLEFQKKELLIESFGKFSLASNSSLPCSGGTVKEVSVVLQGTLKTDYQPSPQTTSKTVVLTAFGNKLFISEDRPQTNYKNIPVDIATGKFDQTIANPNGGVHYFRGIAKDGLIELETGYTSNFGWAEYELTGFYTL